MQSLLRSQNAIKSTAARTGPSGASAPSLAEAESVFETELVWISARTTGTTTKKLARARTSPASSKTFGASGMSGVPAQLPVLSEERKGRKFALMDHA